MGFSLSFGKDLLFDSKVKAILFLGTGCGEVRYLVAMSYGSSDWWRLWRRGQNEIALVANQK
jgi:hypothetical protein